MSLDMSHRFAFYLELCRRFKVSKTPDIERGYELVARFSLILKKLDLFTEKMK